MTRRGVVGALLRVADNDIACRAQVHRGIAYEWKETAESAGIALAAYRKQAPRLVGEACRTP